MLNKKLVSIGCILCMALTCLGQGTGTIRYEVWEGIGGTVVTDLTGNAAFPGSPSWDDELALFETPTNIADNFGGRLYGWLTPDTTGDYTFWIASDDASDLYLSTTDSPDEAVLIALEDSWAGSRAWSNGAEQSAPISLVAGQAYYIEALYKEGGGGDNLAVGWAMSSDMNDIQVIDGAYLTPAPQNPAVLKARIGSPANGAVEVGVDAMLEWTAGPTATMHKVYLSADDIIDDNDLIAETEDTNAVPMLVPGVTYSWRVDEVDADGVNEGYVWTFTVISDQAHYPMPADGGMYSIGIDTELTWTMGVGGMVHHIYISTDKALVDARDMSVATMYMPAATFDPGELTVGAVYYWAVDEFGPMGTIAGPTWSFTAFKFDPIAITDPSLKLYYTFDAIIGGLIDDMSGHANYGKVMGNADSIVIVNDADMGNVLSLPGGDNQYVAAGPTGISGNDLTTIACWAKANSTSIPNWTLIFGFTGTVDAAGGNGSHFNIGSLGGPEGVGAHCWGWEETMVSDEDALEWHHYAMTYDGTTIAYYLDGAAMDSDPNKSNVQDLAIRGDRVQIGSRATQASSFPGDVDECRVYNTVLSEQEIQWAMHKIADVTGPADLVQGVPNDGDWPGAEYPDLAVDNNVNTKFLHRKGGATATGIQVAPAAGMSIVTGLTLTTANDTPARDPISFEVYGSNESIDGPYELIAAGDVNDFAQEAEWPRFTRNATTIAFDNTMAYAFYQVLFPTLRGETQALMQIAEVELIGEVLKKPMIAWVSFHSADDAPSSAAADVGFTEASDIEYTNLLKANGYDVMRVVTSSTPDAEVLNAADLVIIGRAVSSGGYSNAGADNWNSITAPMIITGGYVIRSSRMGYTTGSTIPDTAGDITLAVTDPTHPIFAGIDLVDGITVNPYAMAGVPVPTAGAEISRGISVNTDEINAEGTLLATVATEMDPAVGGMIIGEWEAGATLTHSGGAETNVLGGHRLVFLTGSREPSGVTGGDAAGLLDLYDDGITMFLNAVEYMLLP